MRVPFIEWKQLPRSICYDTPEVCLDVWPVIQQNRSKEFRYTVFSNATERFISGGDCTSEDLACETAVREANI